MFLIEIRKVLGSEISDERTYILSTAQRVSWKSKLTWS